MNKLSKHFNVLKLLTLAMILRRTAGFIFTNSFQPSIKSIVLRLNGSTKNVLDGRADAIINTWLPLAAPPTKEQKRVIEERQVGRSVVSLFAIETASCKYGFPRAFVQYPVGGGVSSGMIRLSCPHLVKAVDEYERQGAIEEFDAMLVNEEESGKQLRENFMETNIAWREIRNKAVTEDEVALMREKLGEEGAASLMNSGIIGVTLGKTHVKCLHAQIADHLVRGTNDIGKMALEKLEERGVDVKGCADCWQQCDLKHTPTTDSWWYVPAKNKQKLKSARLRRHEHKVNVGAKLRDKSAAINVESTADDAANDDSRLS